MLESCQNGGGKRGCKLLTCRKALACELKTPRPCVEVGISIEIGKGYVGRP